VNKPKQPLLVAIVGGSGSGKSWLADKLQAALGSHAGRLSLDDFYRDRSYLSAAKRARLNFDKPSAVDWPTFERVLHSSLHWRKVYIPRYDFTTHCRLARWRVLQPKPIILVEGLWLLRSPRIRKFFGFRIFLDSSMQLRLGRRLARDVKDRGRSRKSVRNQFRNTVEPMHRRFVAPQIHWADIVLKGHLRDTKIGQLSTALRQRMLRTKALRKRSDACSVI
jgi:uridine kinase